MTDDTDGNQRRRLIVERLQSGALPRYGGQRTFGGRGEGAPCACCDQPIAQSDVQYEVEHRDSIGGALLEQVRSIPMHLHCYRLWVEESDKPGAR